MTKRRIHTLIWLLLPLFALRGLVPMGFMVNVSGGEVSMAVCPMHQTVDAGQTLLGTSGQNDAPQKSESKSQCPFAAALSAATFVGIYLPAAPAVAATGFLREAVAVVYLPFGPSRAQQSRAPPALA
jgi:hypothetical protein